MEIIKPIIIYIGIKAYLCKYIRRTKVNLPRRLRPNHNFTVAQEEIKLLDYLVTDALKEKSRTTVKQLLHDRYISVNGTATTKHNLELKKGDKVTLHPLPLPTELNHPLIEVLWQDEDLVLFYKKVGIPTVSSGEEKDTTAMQVLSEHLKKFNPRAKVFLLNRIDKDSSGYVLMAKSRKLQEEMTENWNKYVYKQMFVVAIEGFMPAEEGILEAPKPKEVKDKKGRKMSNKAQERNTAGRAEYRVLQTTATGSLVSLTLLNGRNNRLRKQFAQQKTPIIGDWRNGSAFDKLGRVALDSKSIVFKHPKTGELHSFNRPIAGVFRQWLNTLVVEE